MKTRTKKQAALYERIEKHGNAILAAFPNATEKQGVNCKVYRISDLAEDTYYLARKLDDAKDTSDRSALQECVRSGDVISMGGVVVRPLSESERPYYEVAEVIFELEEADRAEATKLTMRAVKVARWPYSQSGLGFGDPETWTPAMKRHAPVLLRKAQIALQAARGES